MFYATIFTTSLTAPAGHPAVTDLTFQPETVPEERRVVNLYPTLRYQNWEGFGGAFTDAAGYAFSHLTPDQKETALDCCFSAGGLGYTLGRVHVDSCDFSTEQYEALTGMSEDGVPTLSLERDRRYIHPLLRGALNKAEDLHLLYSPWSPPACWKSNGQRIQGGHLLKEHYADYAAYLGEYLLAHRKLGFPVAALTVQNETGAIQTWDSCQFTPEEEKLFLRDYLAPALKERGLEDVLLFIHDHNKERMVEKALIEVDDSTRDLIAGIGYHWYSGNHFEALTLTHDAFPHLKLWRTEGCIELVGVNQDDKREGAQARRYLRELIGDLNHGMTAWFDWNLMLDEVGGPNHVGNFCGSPLRCDTKTGRFTLSKIYDAVWHCSHFIRPGAQRIGTTCWTDVLDVTAFQNPDGSIAVVMMNPTEETLSVNLRMKGAILPMTVEAGTMMTAVIRA